MIVLWCGGVLPGTHGQSETSSSDHRPDEPDDMRDQVVDILGDVGEEVEVIHRPETSPEIEGSQKCSKGDQDRYHKRARTLVPDVVLHHFVDAEHHDGQNEGDEDTVPGLAVLDDNLTGQEDVFVLQLPHAPPAPDHQGVDHCVSVESVQDDLQHSRSIIRVSKVSAGTEDIVDGVSDDGERCACCTLESLERDHQQGGHEEDREQLVAEHVREEEVEDVEAAQPQPHTKQSVQVNDDKLDYGLYPPPSDCDTVSQKFFGQIYQYLH